MPKKLNDVIIFGSSGFVGTNLYIDIINSSTRTVYAPLRTELDLLDSAAVKEYLGKLSNHNTSIVLLAARTPYSSQPKDDFNTMSENIFMCQNVIKGLANSGCREIVYLSTADVYGRASEVISETTPIKPCTNYAAAKAASELILYAFASLHKIPLLILRLSQIYGKADNSPKLIPSLLTSAISSGKIYLTHDGAVLRDFVSVKDVSKIINKAIGAGINEIINIATGTSITTKEVAKIITENSNRKTEIIAKPSEEIALNLVFNNSKLKKLISIEFTNFKYELINLIRYYEGRRA